MTTTIKLTATRVEFTMPDNGAGYTFHVVAQRDPEFGWDASVSFTSHGRATDTAAIEALRGGLEAFMRAMGWT